MMGLKYLMKMSNFKFVQIQVASKGFYKQKQLTDIFTIDVNKIVLKLYKVP